MRETESWGDKKISKEYGIDEPLINKLYNKTRAKLKIQLQDNEDDEYDTDGTYDPDDSDEALEDDVMDIDKSDFLVLNIALFQ